MGGIFPILEGFRKFFFKEYGVITRTVAKGSFLCQGGPRLPQDAFCDGYPDCPLGEDELACFSPQILQGGPRLEQARPGGDLRNKQRFYSMQNVNQMQRGKQAGVFFY